MAKHSIHFATDDTVVDHLRDVVSRAMLEGIDLNRHGRLSRSKIICTAIRYGSEASKAALRPVTPALPETTGTTDADRLMAARGTMSRGECARAAGLKDESSVRNVEKRGMKLAGKLLTWVESVERRLSSSPHENSD